MPNLTLFLSEFWIETELLLGAVFAVTITLYLAAARLRLRRQLSLVDARD